VSICLLSNFTVFVLPNYSLPRFQFPDLMTSLKILSEVEPDPHSLHFFEEQVVAPRQVVALRQMLGLGALRVPPNTRICFPVRNCILTNIVRLLLMDQTEERKVLLLLKLAVTPLPLILATLLLLLPVTLLN
jgi:hypothetical protein